MKKTIDEINKLVASSIDQISILVRLVYKEKDENKHDLLKKSTFSSIYSIYESFNKNLVRLVIHELNNSDIPVKKLNSNLTAFYLNQRLQLYNGRKKFDKQVQFCEEIKKIFDDNFSLENVDDKIFVKKGLYYQQTNEMLDCFGIDGIDPTKKSRFDKLQKHRTAIVHQFINASIPDSGFFECKDLIVDSIYEIANKYISFVSDFC